MKYFLILFIFWSSHIFSSTTEFSGRKSEVISLSIPKDTKSFLVSLEMKSDVKVIVESLIDPKGNKIITSNVGKPTESRIPSYIHSAFSSLIRMNYSSKDVASIFVANSTRVKTIEPGEWKLTLAKEKKANGLSKVFITTHIHKENSPIRPKLSLDLNMDLEGTNMTSEQVGLVTKRVEDFYKDYGIELSINNKIWKDQYPDVSDLETKLDLLQVGKKERAQIYVFERNSQVRKQYQGLAGCLPAPVITHLNKHCGLLVVFDNKEKFDFDRMYKVMAHEIAHYLGLFHIDDDFYPFGKVPDTIEDTDQDTSVANVMHKRSEYFGHIEFTPEQAEIILRNPILYLK